MIAPVLCRFEAMRRWDRERVQRIRGFNCKARASTKSGVNAPIQNRSNDP
jgi:hypothetical protein